jgi:hypothetical protein
MWSTRGCVTKLPRTRRFSIQPGSRGMLPRASVLVIVASMCRAGGIDFLSLQRDINAIVNRRSWPPGCLRERRFADGLRKRCGALSNAECHETSRGGCGSKRVDAGGLHLDEKVVLHRNDLSLAVQPMAKLVWPTGQYTTNISDLVRRAVIDSDSAATDYLFRTLTKPAM